MTTPDTTRLRDLAAESFERGRLDKALEHFLELERIERLPGWAKWAATVCQRMGRAPEAVEAFNRAARGYVERGELLKAAAACKQALQLDPVNAEALRRISELRASDGPTQPSTPAGSGPASLPAGAKPPSAAPGLRLVSSNTASAPRSASPAAAGIESMRLTEVVPGAAPVRGRTSASPGVYHIPLPGDAAVDEEPLVLMDAVEVDDDQEDDSVRVDHDGNVVSGPNRPARGRAPAITTEDAAVAAVEAELKIAEQANAALMRTPFFAVLSPRSFSDLLMDAKLVDLAKGEVLFRQGDTGDALYVVAEGSVQVIEEGSPRRVLAVLQEGEFFGEVALVTDQPRNATVEAAEDTQVIAIGREVVQRLAVDDPNFIPAILRFLRDRLVTRLAASNPLFKGLSPEERQQLKSKFRFLEIDAGTMLLEQGKRPDGLLVLLAGSAEVVRQQDGRTVQLATLKAGDIIGEVALVTQAFPKDALGGRLRRRALADVDLFTSIGTITTKTKCFALELPADSFLKIVHAEGVAFIRSVIEQRAAQMKAVLAGAAPYSEGRLKL